MRIAKIGARLEPTVTPMVWTASSTPFKTAKNHDFRDGRESVDRGFPGQPLGRIVLLRRDGFRPDQNSNVAQGTSWAAI